MDKGYAQSIDWLQRQCDLLHQKKNEVWTELTGAMTAVAMSSTAPADQLFAQVLETEIELCRATSLKSHLEGKDKTPRFDDPSIGGLFEQVHLQEAALVDQFERWKETKSAPPTIADFTPWREAMTAYFLASPGEV